MQRRSATSARLAPVPEPPPRGLAGLRLDRRDLRCPDGPTSNRPGSDWMWRLGRSVAGFSTPFLSRATHRRAARQRQWAIETVFYGPTSACTPIRFIRGDPAPRYLSPRMAGAQRQPWFFTNSALIQRAVWGLGTPGFSSQACVARLSEDGRLWREAATDSGCAPLPVSDCNVPEVLVAHPGTSARAASRISRTASAFVRNRSAVSSRTLRTTARTYAPWVG
jgi:hypothetical protein